MFTEFPSPWLVPTDGTFDLSSFPTEPPGDAVSKKQYKKRLKKLVKRFAELQDVLYAYDRFALLVVFQAMDAAGKDSTIRAVMSGVNPAGFQVYSFKQPSSNELDHDFLWRTAKSLPQRGRIGVFNRSYYEEVLVVRVHSGILKFQRLPYVDESTVWEERFESIRTHEEHLARNGTVVVKFFLNVSKDQQKRRFLRRIDLPEKNWKFSKSDVEERGYWRDYMHAYQEAVGATSKPWAPWYCIPADDKPFARLAVAETIVNTLEKLPLEYPTVPKEKAAELKVMRGELEKE